MNAYLATFLSGLAEFTAQIMVILAPVVAGWIILQLQRRFGLDADERHRKAIEVAMTNAIMKIAGGASIHEAIRYVESRVPDAVAHFGLTAPVIAEKLEIHRKLVDTRPTLAT